MNLLKLESIISEDTKPGCLNHFIVLSSPSSDNLDYEAFSRIFYSYKLDFKEDDLYHLNPTHFFHPFLMWVSSGKSNKISLDVLDHWKPNQENYYFEFLVKQPGIYSNEILQHLINSACIEFDVKAFYEFIYSITGNNTTKALKMLSECGINVPEIYREKYKAGMYTSGYERLYDYYYGADRSKLAEDGKAAQDYEKIYTKAFCSINSWNAEKLQTAAPEPVAKKLKFELQEPTENITDQPLSIEM